MDPDLNKYDLNHRVAHHPKMSDAEWEDTYRAAWAAYYTPDHIRTILRRAAAHPNGRPKRIMLLDAVVRHHHQAARACIRWRGGAFRLKFRRDRRHELPMENALTFYPRYFWETAVKLWHYGSLYLQSRKILNEVLAAPDRATYSDIAIAPQQDDLEVLDLYHATRGGEEALARKRRDDEIRAGALPHAAAPALASEPHASVTSGA